MNITDFKGESFNVKLLQKSSPNQRGALINQFREHLEKLARKKLAGNVCSQMDESDFVQRTMIQADRALNQCRANNEEEFKAWLRQILNREILNQYRYLRRAKRDIRREQGIESPLVDDRDPSDRITRNEEKAILMNAISTLTPNHQTVIQKRYQEGLSLDEIGKQMKKSPAAVRMQWNRAVKQLAAVIKTVSVR